MFLKASGLCERFHHSLKAALAAVVSDSGWLHRLPWGMLGRRPAPKEDLDASPAELVFGLPLCVPGDFFARKCCCPFVLSCGGGPFQLTRLLLHHRCITVSHGPSCLQSWPHLILCL